MAKDKEPPALAPWIPLRLAAVMAYHAVAGKQVDDDGILNNIARLIAGRTRIFTRSASDKTAALVMPDELVEGHIDGGGDELRFADGRAALTDLVIEDTDVGRVIREIQKLYGVLPD